jgi:hypothetical protein
MGVSIFFSAVSSASTGGIPDSADGRGSIGPREIDNPRCGFNLIGWISGHSGFQSPPQKKRH